MIQSSSAQSCALNAVLSLVSDNADTLDEDSEIVTRSDLLAIMQAFTARPNVLPGGFDATELVGIMAPFRVPVLSAADFYSRVSLYPVTSLAGAGSLYTPCIIYTNTHAYLGYDPRSRNRQPIRSVPAIVNSFASALREAPARVAPRIFPAPPR